MEEQLRKLLKDLQEREESRKQELDKFDFQKGRFDDQMKNFEDGMKQDIADGLYKNTPEGRLQQLIEEEKNNIREKYNNQNNELSDESREKIKERHSQEKENDYRQITSAIKDYHLDMVLELNKASRKLTEIEAERAAKIQEVDEKIAEKEAERNAKMQEIDKKIAEKEAEQTHQIILNRDSDIESNVKIKILREEIARLKFQKESISNEDIDQIKAEKESISNEYKSKIEAQSQHLQHCTEQKERTAKLIGQISFSDKSIEDIQQILFDSKQPVEEEQPVVEVVKEEQPVVEEVEEEQPVVEEVEEQPVVEEVEEEQPVVEEVEEEQPVVEEVEEEQPVVEVIEEEQPVVEEVEEEQPVVEEVEEEQPVVEVIKEEQPVVEVIKEKQPIRSSKTVSEDEKNYKYFENNKEKIIKAFMRATGIKKNEANEIFKDNEHCKAIGKICRMWMIQPNKDNNELTKKMDDYYWEMDSKLDIEVSNKGIKYNQELKTPAEIIAFENDKKQFVDEVIKKYENEIPSYLLDTDKVVYDKNIIIAIAMDNYRKNADKSLQLTTSGMKKLGEYLNLVVNPIDKKGSVTYDLEKMSALRGMVNKSIWTPEKVKEFRKIAYQAQNTYAKVIPNSMTKFKWAIKDWFKGLVTKKLTRGEQKALSEESVKENKEKRNKWELPSEQKAYANSRKARNSESKTNEPKSEKEEIEII